jgi:hypothetical protein
MSTKIVREGSWFERLAAAIFRRKRDGAELACTMGPKRTENGRIHHYFVTEGEQMSTNGTMDRGSGTR